MVLKEAFALQNVYTSLINNIRYTFDREDSLFKVTENHMVNKVNKEEQNFTEVIEPEGPSTEDCVKLLLILMDEKHKLGVAIARAKEKHAPELDVLTSDNTIRHSLIYGLNTAINNANARKEKRVKETGYKFNAEGDQVSYHYDKIIQYEPRFDIAEAQKILQEQTIKADEISNEIEREIINSEVYYVNKYNITSYDNVVTAIEKIK